MILYLQFKEMKIILQPPQEKTGLPKLKTAIIINHNSGTLKFLSRLRYLIRRSLNSSDRKVSIFESTNYYPGCIRDLAVKAIDDGNELIVAAGGDGTVNEVAQGILGTGTVLGVIPIGSGNGFARNLGIPLRWDKAIDLLNQPRFRMIDVGTVGDHIFLVSCGFGWEAEVANLFQNNRIRGFLPYAAYAISTFLQYEPPEVMIHSEPNGWIYKGYPMLLTIANMREYGFGATIAPEASFDDGLLDICLIPRQSLLTTIKYTPELFRHRIDRVPGYISRLAHKIIISRSPKANIQIDGSPIPAGHEISLSVMPKALKVVAPEQTTNEISPRRDPSLG